MLLRQHLAQSKSEGIPFVNAWYQATARHKPPSQEWRKALDETLLWWKAAYNDQPAHRTSISEDLANDFASVVPHGAQGKAAA